MITPPRRNGEQVIPNRARVKGRTEVLLLFGGLQWKRRESLFFLYSDLKKGILKVSREKYRIESGPHKDVPQTFLKRGPGLRQSFRVG